MFLCDFIYRFEQVQTDRDSEWRFVWLLLIMVKLKEIKNANLLISILCFESSLGMLANVFDFMLDHLLVSAVKSHKVVSLVIGDEF